MQIINLELDHYNFYCPVSGEYITTEEDGVNEVALSFRGYWFDEFWDEPTIKDEKLNQLWTEYFDNLKASDPDYKYSNYTDNLDEFFQSVDIKNYVVFKIHKIEFSIISDKLIYFVIDMNAG